MTAKRVLISLVCLMTTTLFAVGQVAVKTNVAMDALAIPNAGFEVGLSKKLTLDVPVYYNPWKQVAWKEQDNKLFKLFMVQPELRTGCAISSTVISSVFTEWAVLIILPVSICRSLRSRIWATSVTRAISTEVVSATVTSTSSVAIGALKEQ